MQSAKRFWKTVSVEPDDDGYLVKLDTRVLKTPAKNPLRAPSAALADAIAAEWEAQEKTIDPLSMPFTRSMNAAIDKVVPQRAEVSAMLAAYGETDLLCYRDPAQAELAAEQAAVWDPLLKWAAAQYGAPLLTGTGVMHIAQPEASIAALAAAVTQLGPFALTGFHDLVTISGSLIIGLAVIEGQMTPAQGWAASRVDEEFQIRHWGHDEEAAELAESKHRAFLHAASFCEMVGGT